MSDSSFVVRVALDVPLRKLFDYLPRAGTVYPQGARIQVPFGRRQLIGVVLDTSPHASVPHNALKSAGPVLDEQPALSATILRLCQWAADYYQHPLGEVVLQALPTLLRRAADPSQPMEVFWRVSSDALQNPPRGARQRQLLELLSDKPAGLSEEAIRAAGISLATLKTLQAGGQIERIVRQAALPTPVERLDTALPLNHAQEACLRSILDIQQGHRGILLYGVTGSGKTEIYLQWIQHLLTQQKQVLVLVPEISLTPQTIRRFQRRFGQGVAAYHSGLTELERWRTWDQARNGRIQIVIGTRSAIFLPFQALGAIIVDEEHDSSYKQQDGFRYSARDLAMVRGNIDQIPVLLGSATPSLETLRNVEQGKYQMLRLPHRAGEAQTAQMELLDIKSRPLQGGLSTPLIDQIRATIQQGEQVLLFINRRGYAPVLMCQDCGWMAECRHCDVRMTLHKRPPSLRCHHCDSSEPVPPRCPKCDARALQPMGAGTERTEDELQRIFPDVPIYRIDSDTTRSKRRFNDMLQAIDSGEPCILVGTQILAKGHHFPKVTLVAIINADSGLFSSDFRATERMVQLLVQVAGRSGREQAAGRVVIQTHHADHALLQSIVQDDYLTIALRLLAERSATALPPYQALTLVHAEAKSLEQAMSWLEQQRQYASHLAQNNADESLRVTGPFPATIERKAGRYRAQLHVMSPNKNQLRVLLHYLLSAMDAEKAPAGLRWSVDVDPIDLL